MGDRPEAATMRCWVHGGKGSGNGSICDRRQQSHGFRFVVCAFVPATPPPNGDQS